MKFLIGFFLLFLPFQLFSKDWISLKERSVYIHQGFNKEWTEREFLLNKNLDWLVVTPGLGKSHSLSAKYLNFPQKYNRKFLSLHDSPDEEFTYVFRVFLKEENISPIQLYGIYLATVGLRWQLYVNGELILDKLQDGGNNTRYNYLIPIQGYLLVPGENRFAFRIQGPRSLHLVGFYRSSDYLFGKYDELFNKSADLITLALIVFYFFLGLFHLFLFIRNVKYTYNFIYSLFSVVLSVYLLSMSRYVFYFTEDSHIALKIQWVGFFLLPILGIFFFRKLFSQNYRLLDIALIPINSFFIIGCILFSASWISDIISIYKYIIPIVVLYAFIDISGREFFKDLNTNISIMKENNIKFSQIFMNTLFFSISGNMFLILFIFSILIFIDIFDMIFFARGIFVSQYAFVIFVFSIAFSLSNRYIKTNESNRKLAENLEKKIQELESSQKKYKFLVDETSDLLFVLNNEYKITSLNNAAKRYFGVRPESLINKSFIDLLYTTPKDEHIITHLVMENLQELNEPGKQIQFRARMRTSRMDEPLEFSFRMEAVNNGDHMEYIGKATSALDEDLSKYVIRESQVYRIENFIHLAEEISHRLVRQLKKKLPDYRVHTIRTGLREILVNAIEHGNLNIGFEEKSQHLSKGDYLELISSRQKDPIYKSRKVEVNYILTDHFVSYKITDEGDGFNYKELKKKAMANQSLGREHGRGIMLVENIFDVVEFQGKGNSVYLKIYF